MRFTQITPQELRARRDADGCSFAAAARRLRKEKALDGLRRADTIRDLRELMIEIVETLL
jgi:hypothetical protein